MKAALSAYVMVVEANRDVLSLALLESQHLGHYTYSGIVIDRYPESWHDICLLMGESHTEPVHLLNNHHLFS